MAAEPPASGAGPGTVAQAVGAALVAVGVDHVFGVVGSGNFHVTNAMVTAGARFVASRHEGGAVTMADGFARMSGRPAAVTVHQGCGLTNTMTGLTEAAKSRSPVIVLAAEVAEPRSNFFVDQPALAAAVGARSLRLGSPETAVADACRAVEIALHERRTVLLNLPLHLQDEWGVAAPAILPESPPAVAADGESLDRLQRALGAAQRPVFVAGRGSRGPGCREALERLADRYGALLATSAVAKGLFHGSPWSLDVSGGFASPLAADLIRGADLIVGWGCSLNMWTMRHGALIGPDTTVAQVDDDVSALGAQRSVDVGAVGDVRATAAALLERAPAGGRPGYRTSALADEIAARIRWRDVAYDDWGSAERIDPRTLTIALDDLLPAERIVSIDSGNFMGYPSMFLSVPDERGFCFTQAYQSIGLGLATGIGAALAQPDRLPVVGTGDGGLLMAAAELDTVRRLGLPLVVIVYNDDAYGAEVHHFSDGSEPLDIVRFPPTDIAAIARGYGLEAITVRTVADLAPVGEWVTRWRDPARRTPGLLIDAKVAADRGSWWLEEAFRGH